MLKSMLAATAALAIAGSSVVYAQQRFDGHGGGPGLERHHRPSADDIKAFSDARIAALKAGLQLTPDQEKNWPAFEQAARDIVKLRLQRMQARAARMAAGDQQPSGPFDRLQRRADAMAQRGVALKHLADAGAPLYNSLTDAQKQRFKMLSHLLRRHHRHHMQAGNDQGWRGRGGGHWRQGNGYGRDGGRDGQGFGQHGRRFGEEGRGPGGHFHQLMGDAEQGDQL